MAAIGKRSRVAIEEAGGGVRGIGVRRDDLLPEVVRFRGQSEVFLAAERGLADGRISQICELVPVTLPDGNDPFELDAMIALRHDLHAHPELGFEEVRTSRIVAEKLAEARITVHRRLGKTGVVGTLKVGDGVRRIALRADMDALAMPELAQRKYGSTVENTMHACGHDGHTVMLLAAASIWRGRGIFRAWCISCSSRPRKGAEGPRP